jgi:diguanylate cyclase (GGDEF)-like protein
VQTHLDIRTSERHLEQLARHAQELERLSFEDSLTSIANRRRFDQQLAISLDGGIDPENSLCVALIDLDDFKRINDKYSHSVGDDVLRSVAQAIKAAVRASDLPARIGGDEFVVLFPHTPIETARLVCERIGSKVAAIRWEQWSPELQVRVSIGVAQAEPSDTASALLKRSDAAMFEVKARTSKRGKA